MHNLRGPCELLLTCVWSSPEKLSGERIKLVMEHIWKLQEFCNSMAKLETDGYEYAYLKAIVLFSPGGFRPSLYPPLYHSLLC